MSTSTFQWNTLILQIKESISQVVSYIRNAQISEIEAWHDSTNGADLMQTCVLSNATDVMRLLFSRGCFKTKHNLNQCSQYYHIAAYLGRFAALQILVDERPYDFENKSCICLVNSAENNHNELSVQKTALDFGAEQGQSRIIQLLLNSFYLSSSSRATNMVEAAIEANSPTALNYLLENDPTLKSITDIFKFSIIKHAILKKRYLCVDSLLRKGFRPEPHCVTLLFLCSNGFSDNISRPFEYMTDTVRVLLDQGAVDVNDKHPQRGFPLYSLLESILNWFSYFAHDAGDYDNCKPSEHLQTLELLLDAGADPNYNAISEFTPSSSQVFSLNENNWFSALHSFFIQLDSKDYSWNICEVLELLLSYGANPDKLSPDSELPPIAALFNSPALIQFHIDFSLATVRRYIFLFSQVMFHSSFCEALLKIKEDFYDVNILPEIDCYMHKLEHTEKVFLSEEWKLILQPDTYISEPFQLQRLCKLTIWRNSQWNREKVILLTQSPVLRHYLSNPLI